MIKDLALFADSVGFSKLDMKFPRLESRVSLAECNVPLDLQLQRVDVAVHTDYDPTLHSPSFLTGRLSSVLLQVAVCSRIAADVGLVSAGVSGGSTVFAADLWAFAVFGIPARSRKPVEGVGAGLEVEGDGDALLVGKVSGRQLRVELGVEETISLSLVDPIWSAGVCISVGGSVYGRVTAKLERNTATVGGVWALRALSVDPGYAVVVCDYGWLEDGKYQQDLSGGEDQPLQGYSDPASSFEFFGISKLEKPAGQVAYVADGGIEVQKLVEIPSLTSEFAQDEEDTSNTEKLLSDWQREFGWLGGLIPDIAHLEIKISNFTFSIAERNDFTDAPTTAFVLTISDIHLVNGEKPSGQISLSEGCLIPDSAQNCTSSGEHFIAWIKLGKDFADDSIHSLRVGQYYANLFANIESHHMAKLKRINQMFTVTLGISLPPFSKRNPQFMAKTTTGQSEPTMPIVNSILVNLAGNLKLTTEVSGQIPSGEAQLQTLVFSSWYAPLEPFRELTHLLDSNRGNPAAISSAATSLCLLTALISPERLQDQRPTPATEPKPSATRQQQQAKHMESSESCSSAIERQFGGKRVLLGREGLEIRLPSAAETGYDVRRFALICSILSDDLECCGGWSLTHSVVV